MLGMAAGSGHAEEKTIHMGTMSWEDLTPITGITKKVLEDAGYTVEVTSFSEWGIAYAALAKGDTQVMVSQTDYVAQDYWNRNKNRLEKISPVSHGLYQGIAVPKYVTIDSVEQLNESGRQVRQQDHRHRTRCRPDAGHRQCRLGIRPEAAARRGQHRRHDGRPEVGHRPPGMDRGHPLGAVLDGRRSSTPSICRTRRASSRRPRPTTGSARRASRKSIPTPARSWPASMCRSPTSPRSTPRSAMGSPWTRPSPIGSQSHADLIKRWENIKKD